MFYSVELLSLRRKGGLARCWLAATVSEKIFKRTCKPALIRKIDVSNICEEILSTILVRNNKVYGRFSLYTMAQLMYGAVKILFYQTTSFQDYLYEVNKQLERHIEVQRENINVRMAYEELEIPSISQVLGQHTLPLNLHVIRDEPYIPNIEYIIRDAECFNFGVLTTDEMDLLLPQRDDQPFEIFQRLRSDVERSGKEFSDVPLPDVEFFEKETRLTSARTEHKEALVNVEVSDLRGGLPETPRKRTLKPSVETPTKKTKLSYEEVPEPAMQAAPAPAVEAVPEPAGEAAPEPAGKAAPEPTEEAAPEPAVQAAPEPAPLLEQQLPALSDESLVKVTKQKRKVKFVDKETKLPDALMRMWIHDVKAHTRVEGRLTTNVPPINTLLDVPSMIILGKHWAKVLMPLFTRNIVGPFVAENLYSEPSDLQGDESINVEAVRVDTTNKVRDQLAELSSKIGVTTTELADDSKTLEAIHPDVPKLPIYELSKEFKDVSVRLPEITDSDVKIDEFVGEIEKSVGKEKRATSTKSSFSSRSRACLTKTEVLAFLKILWSDKEHVKFRELISPTHYDRFDAASAFRYLLELHTEKVLVLKQSEPFQDIWIQEYPHYAPSSENGEKSLS